MAECEVSADRTWDEQYHCSVHTLWFRSSAHPDLCPAGAAEEQGEGEAARLHKENLELRQAIDALERGARQSDLIRGLPLPRDTEEALVGLAPHMVRLLAALETRDRQ